MQFFDGAAVAEALPWPALIEAIESAMVDHQVVVPERTAHAVELPHGDDATLLLKPGWRIGDVLVVKAVTFFPDNGALELPTVNAGVLLFDATNGVLLGACDGNELTTRRTAAASAVASKRLARPDASRLLIVGTGALAPMAVHAHAEVHDLTSVSIWGRRAERSEAVRRELSAALPGTEIERVEDLDSAVATADIISCVTSSSEPLVEGRWLRPGTHVVLIGSFSPAMRETDDEVMRRGSVWVDTFQEAMSAGDISQALDSGVLARDDILGDLAGLVSGASRARSDDDEITVFKSAGTAVEDLAAAGLLFET